MQRKRFIEIWREEMTPIIKKKYDGDPHGPACAAMELSEMDEHAEKFWRKFRSSLKNAGEAATRAMFHNGEKTR
jgi:hypothetical protein